MSSPRVAVVTGANKGIGLAIVRNLILSYPSSPFNAGAPLLVYLTARNQSRGLAALEALTSDPSLELGTVNEGHNEIQYHELDIGQAKSIQKFRDFLKEKHPDGIDVVVNNAGIAMNGFDDNVVKETLQCNYYGTLEATRDLLPLIKAGGRLVNVASTAGTLSKYSSSIRSQFLSSKTVPEVTSLMESFKSAVSKGKEKEEGWPSAAYAVSKSGVIGMTRAIAEEVKKEGRGVLVNSCCPGYVKTDMTRGGGVKSVDEGAKTPVLLALGDIGGKAGLFWKNEEPMEW